MQILFTSEFLIQYDIIKQLSLSGNIDFSNLDKQISLCIKVMHEADNDTDSVLRKHLRKHKGAKKEGYLASPNDKCISIDLDGEHRLVAYRNGNEAIIISSICHYDSVEKKLLFKNDIDSIATRIKKELSTGGFDLFDPVNSEIKEEILSSVKNTDASAYDRNFNNNICPLSPNVYVHNLKKRVETLVEDNRYYGQETTDEDKSNAMRSFIDENHAFLERTIVNARCFNNVASVVCGNGDLKETTLLKLELQDNLYDNIAKVFKYVKNSNISDENKDVIFKNLTVTVLKAFDVGYDGIIYGSNEASPEYVLANAIDKSFYGNIHKDLNTALNNGINKKINKETLFNNSIKNLSDKKSIVEKSDSKNFFAIAKLLWNNFLPSKKKKNNDDSAIPENKNVKQEENITKKETIAESQENQSLNNQEKSLSLKRRKYMNDRIQLKPEASNEETQKSDRMKMMQSNSNSNSNKERNNACDNVISTSQKKGRSR